MAELVVLENLLLLVLGLACGGLAALVAVVPHLLGRGAAIPWASLAGALAMVLAAGLVASLAAVRAVARQPLLGALQKNEGPIQKGTVPFSSDHASHGARNRDSPRIPHSFSSPSSPVS